MQNLVSPEAIETLQGILEGEIKAHMEKIPDHVREELQNAVDALDENPLLVSLINVTITARKR